MGGESVGRIFDAIQRDQDCRMFHSEHRLRRGDIELLIEAARNTPSEFNLQPWHFVVSRSNRLKAKLSSIVSAFPHRVETSSHLFLGFHLKESALKVDDEHVLRMLRGSIRTEQEFEFERNECAKFLDRLRGATRAGVLKKWIDRQCHVALGRVQLTAALLNIDCYNLTNYRDVDVNEIFSEELNIDRSRFELSFIAVLGKSLLDKTRKDLLGINEVSTIHGDDLDE